MKALSTTRRASRSASPSPPTKLARAAAGPFSSNTRYFELTFANGSVSVRSSMICQSASMCLSRTCVDTARPKSTALESPPPPPLLPLVSTKRKVLTYCDRRSSPTDVLSRPTNPPPVAVRKATTVSSCSKTCAAFAGDAFPNSRATASTVSLGSGSCGTLAFSGARPPDRCCSWLKLNVRSSRSITGTRDKWRSSSLASAFPKSNPPSRVTQCLAK
mmetsp:Transcript_85720/g.171602  ORF Transcript_85720/g.171602 Transcript_85720/m.171602 type:complete len:217 (+) Transcript_85720:442-1092(+)